MTDCVWACTGWPLPSFEYGASKEKICECSKAWLIVSLSLTASVFFVHDTEFIIVPIYLDRLLNIRRISIYKEKMDYDTILFSKYKKKHTMWGPWRRGFLSLYYDLRKFRCTMNRPLVKNAPPSSRWMPISWCHIGARPSATILLTRLWLTYHIAYRLSHYGH